MPQFPDWKQQLAAWTEATRRRQSQVGEALGDLAARGRQTTSDLTERATDLAGSTRDRAFQLPTTIVEQVRTRLNLLGLATREDLEEQSRLGRNRVAYVINEFLEVQREHDQELRDSLRTQFHEELLSLRLEDEKDDVIVLEPDIALDIPRARNLRHDEFDDVDDDDLDLDDDDEEFDLFDDDFVLEDDDALEA
ncbi:MAG TPA: hypothetical protein VL856_20240 [Acidimicrobiia bacterium]|jgi:hypothetical protein|nr:hypothetical protein [Acidimicrobiia bacterium]